MTGAVLAHGLGTRADLPLPTWLALYGAAAVVLASFLLLGLLWSTARLSDPQAGRPLPRGVQRALESGVTRTAVQAVALALTAVVTIVAITGSDLPPRNIAPWALFVTFWVGLVPVSLVLGPVWRYANPLRLLHRLLHRLLSRAAPPRRAAQPLDAWGMWPAAAALSVFVWLELVYPERSAPGTAALFLLVYGAVQVAAALWFGEGWFAQGDGFEVYSTLVARLSPWGVRDDGRWVLRSPLRNAATLPERPGLAAVVVVLVGSTAFDGLSRTRFWTSGPGAANDTLSGTLGLFGMVAIVAALYVLGTRASGRLAGTDPVAQPSAYAHTIVPIAVGYAIAHYFSLLLIDGQMTWILASNPFDQDGVDLFGTYGNAVDYAAVSVSTIAYVQVAAIVVGHVLGVVLAHDRSLRGTTGAAGAREQAPLVAVMVTLTIGGLALLFGA